jgi:hypothetical protein
MTRGFVKETKNERRLVWDAKLWGWLVGVVTPIPVVALLVLVEARILAVGLVTLRPIRVIQNLFVMVPAMVVVMIFIVVGDVGGATCAGDGCA